MDATSREALEGLYREEWPRIIAILARQFGDIDLAEEAAQEAIETALTAWPADGVPRSPRAWLLTVARRKALDRVRRDALFAQRVAERRIAADLASPAAEDEALDALGVGDEQLAMMMACAHPAIGTADQVAMMVRFVGGLTTAEAAQALLQPVPTLQARLTRAKKRISTHRIPIEVPRDPDVLAWRLPVVLTAISLVFTEGYDATSGASLLRRELTGEAIRLATLVASSLPDEAEAQGLLALLLLSDARAGARHDDADGVPIPLEDQDRSLWDHRQIADGCALAERAAAMPGAGRFAIQAAIAAVHGEAPSFEETDWPQIVALYDLLLGRGEDPIVRMNRAIAVARRDTPEVGLGLLTALSGERELARHYPFHAAMALLYEETGDAPAARDAWTRAREYADAEPHRRFVERRLARL